MNRLRTCAGTAGILYLCACGSFFDLPDPVPLRFEGVVTAQDGTPVRDATVTLQSALFVWGGAAAQVLTDEAGRYLLEHETTCRRGDDLYHDNIAPHWLTVDAAGYQTASSVESSAVLKCVTTRQTIDFVLRPLPGS